MDLEYAEGRRVDYQSDAPLEIQSLGNTPRVFRPGSWTTKTIGLELTVGFNATYDSDDYWENNEDFFWAGLWAKFGNFLAFESAYDGGIELMAGVGYNNLRVLDQMAFNANAFVHSKISGERTDIGFKIVPELVWNLIPHGSITFGYTIGYNWHLGDNRLRKGAYNTGVDPWIYVPTGANSIESVLFDEEWYGFDRDGRLTQHFLEITFKWSF